MKKSAVISKCSLYRYHLTRRWDNALPPLGFIMLNPSRADANDDDPTIRKCIGFAKRLGYGGIEVANLYAYRTAYPSELKSAGYPIGDKKDAHIYNVAENCEQLICAWGANAKGLARPVEVLSKLGTWNVTPWALKINAGGEPAHPLMLPYSCQPFVLET